LLFTALSNLAWNEPAASQQEPAVTVPGKEVRPRGQREVKDVTFGDWKKLCFKPGGAKALCRTSITGTFPTGQMAVRLDIVEREDDATKRIQIFSPVGMYLPSPVELTIDQGRPYRVPYTWCLTNSCIAGAIAKPLLVTEMSQGRLLRLQFIDSSLLSLVTSLPLGQFSTVHRGSPTQTFEQRIDE
jgi:invasion protein IalB